MANFVEADLSNLGPVRGQVPWNNSVQMPILNVCHYSMN